MRCIAVLLLVSIIAGCGAPRSGEPASSSSGPSASSESDTPSTTATAAVASTPPAAPPPAASRPEISIDQVVLENPLVVRGHARTFENSVSVRVRDARGTLITETHVTSVGESGQHNPYEAQLWIADDPGRTLTVEAFEYSAKDGSVRSLTKHPVEFTLPVIPVTLVFPVGDCTNLQSFERSIPKSRAMARLLVEALIAGPNPSERGRAASSPFPRGSAVNRIALRDGELAVDFNERLRNVGGACAATAIRESTVRTLRQLPTVRSVVISAAGSRELALQP